MMAWATLVILFISFAATNSQDSGCGTPMYQRGTSGNFSSMNYPNNYVKGANCVWQITAPVGYRIRLHFNESFSVLGESDCWKAGVRFTQPYNKYSGPYCEESAPPADFFTLSNSITVDFTTHSSESTLQTGFSITWTAFSATMESGCGGPKYLFGQSGSISSMNYPKDYHRWASCRWVITVPAGKRVKLRFNSVFDLERKTGVCKDYVTATGTGPLCGQSAPGDVVSLTNEATVDFFSDGGTEGTGFSLSWTVVAVNQGGCGDSIQTGLNGSFSSMNYPDIYAANANCVWSISVIDGYRVRLQFNKPFFVEKSNDIVTIYEESLKSVTYGPYSGSTVPSDILSYDSDVTVKFTSNGYLQYEGFKITWTAVTNDIKTFRPNNNYICHCYLNVQCDSSGACRNEACDQGWYGEYCQTGNAAIGRPATQSSTYEPNTAAGKAVDNDRNQLMSGGSCTLTAELPLDNQPWWGVDLGKSFALLNLTIYNRGNDGCQNDASCKDRLKNFVVWMADVEDPDSSKGKLCVEYPGTVALGAKQQLLCDPPAVGRYLYIKLLDNSTALSICEVVIHAFQYRDCTNQRYGPNCNHRCRCADRTEQCNSASGACVGKCIYDYSGKYCEKLMPFMKQAPMSPAQTGYNITITTPAWSKQLDGGDGKVLKYRLEYKKQIGPKWINCSTVCNTDGSSWIVTGLTDLTVYQFRFVLLNRRDHENDKQWGRPGAVLEAKTRCPPVVTPKITEITSGINRSLTWPNRAYLLVKIENFVDAGMPESCFDKYTVFYNGSSEVINGSAIRYQHKLTGLQPYTSYDVYIELNDIDGKFARSSTQNTSTAQDTPGKVTNLAVAQYNKTLNVTWSEPAIKYGEVTAYFVEHKLAGYGQCQDVRGATAYSKTLAATTHSYLLPEGSMCPYCRYNVTVTAETSAGMGEPVALTNQFTSAAVPTVAPPAPIVQEMTSKMVAVSWTAMPCEARNGPEGKYAYRLVNASEQIVDSPGPGSTPNLIFYFHNLPVYTLYRFEIAYKNKAGVGPYSNVSFTTLEAAPGTVESISVTTSATTLKVKWEPPISPNGIITSYKVGYKHRGYGPTNQFCKEATTSWVYSNTSGPVLEHAIGALCPYCSYDVEVVAVNGAGEGRGQNAYDILTNASKPTAAPPTPTNSSIGSREVTFTWTAMPCEDRSGPSVSYIYRLIEKSSGREVRSGNQTTPTSVSLTELIPYTTYGFQVAFRNSAGLGPYTNRVFVITEEEVPRAPSMKKAGSSLKSISVQVVPPVPPHGKILKYNIDMWQTGGNKSLTVRVNITATNLTHTFNNLETDTNYTVKARGWTSIGAGNWSEDISIRTIEGIPDPPNSIKIIKSTTSSLKIRWTEPRFPNGILKPYKLSCTPIFSYDNAVNDNKDKHTTVSNPAPHSKEVILEGLKQATEYNCSISAQTSIGYGPTVSARNWTKPEREEVPGEWISSVTVTAWSATTVTLDIKEVPQKVLRSGEVKAVRVGVKMTSAKSLRRRRKRATALSAEEHDQLTGYEEAKEKGHTSYIAAELAVDFKGAFVIGDGMTYGGYQNPPLVSGQTYDVIYGIVTSAGGSTTVSFSSLGERITVSAVNMGAAVGVTIAMLIILVAVIVAVVLIVRKRRTRRKENGGNTESEKGFELVPALDVDMNDGVDNGGLVNVDRTRPEPEPVDVSPDRSIPCSGILKHNKMMKSNESAAFLAEFKKLPADLVRPCTIGQLEKNRKQNRYRNIIAYDHSRVILKPVGNEESDYINANYIDGYDGKKVFIASQGPREAHIIDMWRMIWQERCTAIVMLTNLTEKGKEKCAQYWPSEGSVTHGPFKIELNGEDIFSDYVKRTMRISLDGHSRIVTLYHFIVWPDHSVPQFASTLLNLRATVMKDYGDNYGKIPILIHCSAGVGRTGTLIAIDYLIRQGIAEKKVNVFDCVLKLREQRPNMVQNASQYEHVHDAMAEYFQIGIAKIPSEEYPEKYTALIKIPPGKSMCNLQKQYMLLPTFSDEDALNKKIDTDHRDKNRYQDIVPAESSRPMLSLPVNGWDNYINAVYLTGFGPKDNYIATQLPLPHTVKDIWRLVDDTGLSTIVMMNTVKQDDNLAPIYWPQEAEKVTYGPLVIEGKQVDTSHSDITIRDFQVSRVANSRGVGEKPVRLVRQFHLQNWPDDQATPASPTSVVDLLDLVQRWQQRAEGTKILVQCMDGASQSGVFCVAHSVIEKVKVDHEVDVFQYVRLLRTNRPQLINTYEQYKFVHEIVLRYLSQFDIYANFN